MPDLGTLVVFAVAALALVAIPGPNHLYIVTRSIAQGRRAGYASSFGIESGTLVHIAAAAVGLSALIASSAAAFTIVKYAGVAYLIYLGVRAFRRPDEAPFAGQPSDRRTLRRVFLDGLMVNTLNPKVALFFLAFLPQFLDPDRAVAPQIVVLGLVLIAIGLPSNLIYATVAGVIGARLRDRPSFWRRQRHVEGTVYLGLGLAAAVTGERRS